MNRLVAVDTSRYQCREVKAFCLFFLAFQAIFKICGFREAGQDISVVVESRFGLVPNIRY